MLDNKFVRWFLRWGLILLVVVMIGVAIFVGEKPAVTAKEWASESQKVCK